jgi:predicted Fe-Mo cluster-binding NifX family protein
LNLIAYRKNESQELGPGIEFFEWARRMVVDAYYTSPIGIKAIGYMGNTAVAKFEVPQEAIDYAVKRSPV